MRVFIPKRLDAQTMYIVLGQIFNEHGFARSNQYVLDFGETQYVDGAGLVLVDTVLLRLQAEGQATRVQPGKKLPQKVLRLLKILHDSVPDDVLNEELSRRRKLSEQDGSSPEAQPATGHQDLRFHRFCVDNARSWLHSVFNNWLAHKRYTSSLVIAPQTQFLLHLMDNVKMHAGVEMISISTSFNAERDEFRIVLSDAGRGIPATISPVRDNAMSDAVRIAEAVEGRQPKDGTRSKEGGLRQLVKTIIDQQEGKISVTSGLGRLSCFRRSGGEVHLFEPAHAFYPGTMIDLMISANSIKTASTLNEPAPDPAFILE